MKKIFIKHFKLKVKYSCFILIIAILCSSLPLSSQTNSEGFSPQYLFPDFTEANVKMKNGNCQTIMLNYNTVSQKMVYEQNGNLFDMVSLAMVDTVLLGKNKFVPVENAFYELLLIAPISLFIEHKGELVPPGTPAAYGGTSQVSNTKYMESVNLSSGYVNLNLPKDYTVKKDIIYWVRVDKNMYSFLNARQFLKIFPEKQTELKQFIKQNRIKFDNPSNMVMLLEHCNELMQ